MNQKLKKIEDILKSKYNSRSFTDLVREIFPKVEIIAPDRFNREFTNFSSHIAGSSHIGMYTDPNDKKLLIHAVQLKKETFVENSRSTQRSYAKKLIESGNADAAFIAFYTEDDPRWRISFVRLDYKIKFENGRLKATENLTPAKRYSYLLGEYEPCHTAVERLNRFIIDEPGAIKPTLDDLEDAFSVEKVTDEFFSLYCEKFHQLREALEGNPDFVAEASQHNYTSAQFAKKLLGQIVFLYFLQKKGWLGVNAWPHSLDDKGFKKACYARGAKSRKLIPKIYIKVAENQYCFSSNALKSLSDEDEETLASCVVGQPWGTGPRNFMRKLYDFSQKKHTNFFDDYLEPLFYNALNVNRGEQGYDPALHCRIPFLSGGLFEPIDGYDWEHNNFSIPNELFSNKGQQDEYSGDGILDIFDRYNFTMSEDEPMEREVAIDPEMLGKVFENLLEVNDRRSKGAFYTPREIVHYMCQETLITYLVKKTGLNEKDIRDFILLGDFLKDADTSKDRREGRQEMLISPELFKIDRDGNVAVNRLKDIDCALANVRIVDPAVGSGAFPLGMLNEIVRARQNISAYMAITMNAYAKRMMYNNERSPYSLKRETIKNCIFAADIEPSAVDIAQLRLWLSLVIDDEINPSATSPLEGHRNPTPLPNLECNIVCGNSLIDEYEGIKLINDSDLIGTAKNDQQTNFFQSAYDVILPKLLKAQDDLFNCDNMAHKEALKDTIVALKDELVKVQLQGKHQDVWTRYQTAKRRASKPFVLWQLDFARVFHEKGGFDAVIGNPPYIQLQKAILDSGKKLGDLYEHLGYSTFTKTGDIYCLFYEKGYSLLHNRGILAFITSNKWMRAKYGEKLRDFLAKNTNPLQLIDFAGQKVFDSATVDVNILIFSKEENKKSTTSCIVKEKCKDNLSVYIRQNSALVAFKDSSSWITLSPIEQSIKAKIEATGIPLREWDICINYGIKTGFNEAFIITGAKKKEFMDADPKSVEIIRPILRGKDIHRYGYDFANSWLINVHNGLKNKNIPRINIDDYPSIKEYLDLYYPRLAKRVDKGDTPYNLRSCAYMDDFSKQKIVWSRLCRISKTDFKDFPRFVLVPEDYFVVDSLCFFTGEDLETLLKALNSSFAAYYFLKTVATLDSGGMQMRQQYVENFPIPKGLAFDNEVSDVDTAVYNAFRFTESEIQFIKDFLDRKREEIIGR